jgi:hypothetical protein
MVGYIDTYIIHVHMRYMIYIIDTCTMYDAQIGVYVSPEIFIISSFHLKYSLLDI